MLYLGSEAGSWSMKEMLLPSIMFYSISVTFFFFKEKNAPVKKVFLKKHAFL